MDLIDVSHKKILVTGGCGFLGSCLVESLIENQAVVAVIDLIKGSTDKVAYHQLNLKNENELHRIISDFKPDFIYHLAANLNRTRDFNYTNDLLETNLKGTVNLLNALKDVSYKKFIYISTSDVYGGKYSGKPFKENDTILPASPYGLSKYAAEITLQTFSKIEQKNYTILRLFNFFGNGLPQSFFISQLISALNTNTNFDMTLGEQERDFLYIEDVTEALLSALRKEADQQVFNVSSGQGRQLKTLALALKELVESDAQIRLGSIPYRKNEIWHMIGDNRKIFETLGWRPKYSLEEGLKRTLTLMQTSPKS